MVTLLVNVLGIPVILKALIATKMTCFLVMPPNILVLWVGETHRHTHGHMDITNYNWLCENLFFE